eukprot:6891536-Lingulodinium_polyedra.AAC.1
MRSGSLPMMRRTTRGPSGAKCTAWPTGKRGWRVPPDRLRTVARPCPGRCLPAPTPGPGRGSS